jgi:PAS domain S-box-containing protein
MRAVFPTRPGRVLAAAGWLGLAGPAVATPAPVLPVWWPWALTAAAAVLLVVVGANGWLRHQIRRQTAQLKADLLRRRAAEAELERQRSLFQALIRTLPDPVWLKDPEGVYLACNHRFEQLYGAPEADIVGRTDRDFVDPEQADFFRHHDRAAITAGRPMVNEEWLTFADGYRGLFETTKAPLPGAGGTIIGVLGIAHDITERTRGREALRQSEQRLDLAMRIARQGWYELNLETGAVQVGDAYPRLLGYAPEAFSSSLENWLAHVHPDDRAGAETAFRRALEIPEASLAQYRRQTRSGDWLWLESIGKVVERDADGRPRRMVGIHMDISSRKAAEQALAESHQRFSSLYSTMAEGVALHRLLRDPAGEPVDYLILDANPAFETHTGLAPAQVMGRQASAVYGDVPYLQVYARVVGSGQPETFEAYFQPLGKTFTISVVAPAPEQFATIFTDVTERVRLEAALRQASARFRAIIEASPIPMAVNDDQLRITYVNAAFTRTFGYALADIPTVADWWPKAYPDPDYRAEVERLWQTHIGTVLARGEAFEPMEVRVTTKNGAVRTVLVSGAALPEGLDAIHLVTLIDITERKQADQELLRHREHLEDLVAMRTRELSGAKRAAEAASVAKSVFLANMSHELRTPLNAIMGLTDLLRRNPDLPRRERRHLEIIGESGEHLLALINDVLEISRIEAGHIEVQQQDLDLRGLLDTLITVMGARARDRGLTLRLELDPPDPPPIRADLSKLRQILVNLLSNAVKYTPRGGVTLSAGVTDGTDGELWLRVAVADTGIGIAAGELERIFEAFYQTPEGIRQGEGTGLGLAIVGHYARLLGGTLDVHSTPGAGSVFTLELPVRRGSQTRPEALRERQIIGLAPDQPRRRVLVAEDDTINQEVIRLWLEEVGFSCRVVADGAAAVQAFRTWRPDLILMDIRMPVMDGLAATRAIRGLSGGAEVPVIAFTASAFDEEREPILAAGCDEVLTKPLEPARFFQVLGRYLPVTYEYAEPIPSPRPEPAPVPERVPAACRERLAELAVNLDATGIRDLAAELQPEHPGLALHLLERMDAFDFASIDALLRSPPEPPPG